MQLPPEQQMILAHAFESGSITTKVAIKRMGLTPPIACRALDGLLDGGLLRFTHRRRGRSFILEITPSGKDVVRDASAVLS